MKLLLIILILLNINNFQSLTIKSLPEPKVRVRRSIHTLDPPERQALFWSIKVLSVLPPPEAFSHWNLLSLLKIPTDNLTIKEQLVLKPQSIHELLIASHVSSCQHSSLYFSYYHRHLTVLAELWMNFAHSILKGGKSQLLQHYGRALYKKHQRQWDAVFEEYHANGCSELDQISLHYWDIANYRFRDDILLPMQFVSPEDYSKQLDSMDKLHFRVRNYYPWEYSVKRFFGRMNLTWEELESRLYQKKIFNKGEQDKGAFYTQKQLRIVQSRIDARNTPEQGGFKQYLSEYLAVLSNSNQMKQEKVFRRKLKQYFFSKGKNDTLPIQILSAQQRFLNFGANFTDESSEITYKNHYITKRQRRQMNYAYADTKIYNMMKPHYALAKSLYNDVQIPFFKQFINTKRSLEFSHNIRHNYYGKILKDAQFSILGSFFYIFHSSIDMQLQLKIRAQNAKDKLRINGELTSFKSLYQFLAGSDRDPMVQMITKGLLKIDGKQIKNRCFQYFSAKIDDYLSSLQRDAVSTIVSKIPRNKIGSYLIFDYNDPLFANKVAANQYFPEKEDAFEPAFPFIDLILTPSNIRESFNLSSIYRSIYSHTQGRKYEGIADLASYPFDYTYEVYNGPDRPAEILNSDASNPPLYLCEMREEVQEVDDRLKANIQATIETMYESNFSSFRSMSPALQQLYQSNSTKNAEVIKANLFKTYNNTLFSRFYAYVRYALPSHDQQYQVRLRLKPQSSCRSSMIDSLRSFGLDEKVVKSLASKQGVVVSTIYARPRRNACRKCSRYRQMYLDWGTDLYERNPKLWVAYNRLILGKSAVFDDQKKCVSNSTELFSKPARRGSPITVEMVRGAKQLNYMMSFEGAAGNPAQVVMTIISSLSFRAQTAWPKPHQPPVIMSQQFESLYGLRSFLPILADDSERQIYNRFQTKFYKSVKGYIMKQQMGMQNIQLYIPFFYNLLNINIKWSYQYEDSVQPKEYVIEDLDYEFKNSLFQNYQF